MNVWRRLGQVMTKNLFLQNVHWQQEQKKKQLERFMSNRYLILARFYLFKWDESYLLRLSYIIKKNLNTNKKVRINNGFPVLTVKLLGRTKNETRSMNEACLFCTQKRLRHNRICPGKWKNCHFYFLLNACHYIEYLKNWKNRWC